MGIMSTLALLALPLLKRPELASKNLPETLDPRIVENAVLKGRIAELEADIDDLKGRLDAEESAHMWTRRDRDYWYEAAGVMQAHARAQQPIDYGPLFGFQQSRASAPKQPGPRAASASPANAGAAIRPGARSAGEPFPSASSLA